MMFPAGYREDAEAELPDGYRLVRAGRRRWRVNDPSGRAVAYGVVPETALTRALLRIRNPWWGTNR